MATELCNDEVDEFTKATIYDIAKHIGIKEKDVSKKAKEFIRNTYSDFAGDCE